MQQWSGSCTFLQQLLLLFLLLLLLQELLLQLQLLER
jgi:hypothetical protein